MLKKKLFNPSVDGPKQHLKNLETWNTDTEMQSGLYFAGKITIFFRQLCFLKYKLYWERKMVLERMKELVFHGLTFRLKLMSKTYS